MLFFGAKSKAIWVGQALPDVSCDFCSQSKVFPRVFLRYAHICFMPVFPMQKRVYFECAHCKRTRARKEIPTAMGPLADRARKAAKIPKQLFLGVPLVAALLGFALLKDRATGQKAKAIISAPAIHDYYVFDTKRVPTLKQDAHRYIVAHVLKVTPQEVEVELGSRGYESFAEAKRTIEQGDVKRGTYFNYRAFLPRPQLARWQSQSGVPLAFRR